MTLTITGGMSLSGVTFSSVGSSGGSSGVSPELSSNTALYMNFNTDTETNDNGNSNFSMTIAADSGVSINSDVSRGGGTSDVLDVPGTSTGQVEVTYSGSGTNPFAFGTGDFTIEYWAKLDSTELTNDSYGHFFDIYPSSGAQRLGLLLWRSGIGPGHMSLYYGPSGARDDTMKSDTYAADANWHHYAFCRDNGTLKAFIDGDYIFGVSDTTNYNALNKMRIGGDYATGYHLQGEIDNFRIEHSALYTTTTSVAGTNVFTPSHNL